jgi:hypothetical protein
MKSRDHPVSKRQTRSAFIVLSFATALVFLYLRTFLLPATPLFASGDEIHYFMHAVRMLHGQLPYRDFFTFVLPGTDVLYAGVFGLLGVHQWVAQGLVVAVGSLLTGVVVWVSSRILSGPLVLLPGFLFLVFDFNSALDATHHWWSTMLVLAATGVLLGGRSDRRVVAAGALCGVSAFFTQTQGGLGLIAIAFYLLWTRDLDRNRPLWRRQLFLLLAFTIALGGLSGYFLYTVGLRTIAYWTLYFPVAYFSTLKAHTPGAYFLSAPALRRPSDLLNMAPYFFIHLAVPLIYVLCMVRLVREKNSMEQQMWGKVLLLTLVGFALFVTVMSAATYLRLCVIAPPAMVLCVWYFRETSGLGRWIRMALWTAAIVLLAYLPVVRQRSGGTVLEMPTGRAAFSNATQYGTMQWFAENARPGDSIFDNPMVAFALALESPASVDYVTTGGFTRPEQVAEVVRTLEERRTRFVTLYPGLHGPVPAGDNLGPFRQYVYANYHLVRTNSAGQIWERN